MQRQVIKYASPADALVALIRQLITYENRYQMTSADFYAQYQQGQTSDEEDFVDWAGNYQHYTAIKQEIDAKLQNVA